MNTLSTCEPRGSLSRRLHVPLLGALAMLFSGSLLAHQQNTSTSMAFSDANPTDGDVVTITGTATFAAGFNGNCNNNCETPQPVGTPVSGVTMKIQVRVDVDEPDPVLAFLACGEPATNAVWLDVDSGATNGSGQFSANFDTTGLGDQTICFRAQTQPSGGPHGSALSRSGELGLDIDVAECPVDGVVLTNPQVSGGTNPGGAAQGPWTLTMEITNCLGETVDFKVQGGANAWAPYNSPTLVSAGSYIENFKRKNTVITWNVTLGHGQSERIRFTVGSTASVIACGEITDFLSGAWSAAYIDPFTLLPAKTPYTNRATITSLACP